MPPLLHLFGDIEAWASLTNGTLGEDYLPTRDCTSPDGCIFSYKQLSGELAATEVSKGRHREHRGAVFGEVSGHSTERGGLLVLLGPLPMAGPRGQAAYNRQIEVLDHIIKVERDEQVGQTRSWIAHRDKSGAASIGKAFYVFFPPGPRRPAAENIPLGTPVAVDVHMCRIDDQEGSMVHRTYRLYAANFMSFHAPATSS
ncbi:hypothetical protein C8R47DRAFT_1328992 [Mycena vitilis]|nr:hypothetical protein C8R47DRAFT_1328992 [Mycena vitilis]